MVLTQSSRICGVQVRVAGVTYRAMLFSPYLSVSANEVPHNESQAPPSGP